MLQILSQTLSDPWFARQLAPLMFQQRHRVFKQRMNWAVQSLGHWEIDRYDTPNTRYILAWDAARGQLHGSWRLRPMNQPSLMLDVFPELLGGQAIDLSDRTWEISRFAVESSDAHGQQFGFGDTAQQLVQQTIAHAATHEIDTYLMVISTAVERLLRHQGLALERIGPCLRIGRVRCVACRLPINHATLAAVGLLPATLERAA